MPLNRIVLPLHAKQDVTPLATAAFALAKKFDTEVEGVFAQPSWTDRVAYPGAGASASDMEEAFERPRQEAEAARSRAEQAFQDLAKQHPDVRSTFIAKEGRADKIISRRGYYADLTILGSLTQYHGAFWRDIGDGALYYSGRPVIVVPAGVTPEHFGGDLLIAWRESTEASRAVAAAKPFYEVAEHIRILTVGDDAQATESTIQIRNYVAAHGKDVEIEILDTGEQHVAEQILARAAERPGTMLVMGAYSHPQWQERTFGGVTETILHKCPVPVLMAH